MDTDVLAEVRVLAESPPIPNQVIVFGPEFPQNLRRQIEKVMVDIADPENPSYEDWENSLGAIYNSSGLAKAKNKDWVFLRSVIDAGGLIDWTNP